MGKIIGYSAIAIVAFTAFFYFYDAAIFEANIVEQSSSYSADVSLKALFDNSALPNGVSLDRLVSVKPSVKGIFLLIICLLGLPIMIAYRVANNKPSQNSTTK